MKKIYSILFLAAALLPAAIKAQDIHLTQYYFSPLSLNPALTGVFNGDFRVQLNNREQWTSAVHRSYSASRASYDQPIGTSNWSGGIIAQEMHAGNGGYTALNVMLSASYRISLERDHFFLGLQGGFGSNYFNMNNAAFAENFDAINGYNRDINPTTENFNSSSYYPDFNFGALWIHSSNNGKVTPFFGATAFHINRPDQSFFNNGSSHLPRRYLGHAGVRMNVSNVISITPVGMYYIQKEAQEISVGALTDIMLDNANTSLQLGGFYRFDDAASAFAGINYKGLTVGLSYDITTSTLARPANNNGAFEFSLSYTKAKTNNAKKKFICPRI